LQQCNSSGHFNSTFSSEIITIDCNYLLLNLKIYYNSINQKSQGNNAAENIKLTKLVFFILERKRHFLKISFCSPKIVNERSKLYDSSN